MVGHGAARSQRHVLAHGDRLNALYDPGRENSTVGRVGRQEQQATEILQRPSAVSSAGDVEVEACPWKKLHGPDKAAAKLQAKFSTHPLDIPNEFRESNIAADVSRLQLHSSNAQL